MSLRPSYSEPVKAIDVLCDPILASCTNEPFRPASDPERNHRLLILARVSVLKGSAEELEGAEHNALGLVGSVTAWNYQPSWAEVTATAYARHPDFAKKIQIISG